jgi:hypothetical protein
MELLQLEADIRLSPQFSNALSMSELNSYTTMLENRRYERCVLVYDTGERL